MLSASCIYTHFSWQNWGVSGNQWELGNQWKSRQIWQCQDFDSARYSLSSILGNSNDDGLLSSPHLLWVLAGHKRNDNDYHHYHYIYWVIITMMIDTTLKGWCPWDVPYRLCLHNVQPGRRVKLVFIIISITLLLWQLFS